MAMITITTFHKATATPIHHNAGMIGTLYRDAAASV
jgi:hypothetical protein